MGSRSTSIGSTQSTGSALASAFNVFASVAPSGQDAAGGEAITRSNSPGAGSVFVPGC